MPAQERARRTLGHALTLLGYMAVALAFSWPLPRHLSTHLTGSPGGDTGAYVWNLWVFHHALGAGSPSPFLTSYIFALTSPADLTLHNYTVFANLLAYFLQDALGLIATFNLIYLALHTLSAYALFLLARHVTGRTAEAWLAGLLFGFSPFLSARGTAHFSLVAAAPLPLFLLFVLKARASGRARHAVGAGLVLGWAAYCDPYYLVFCLLMLAVAMSGFAFETRLEPREPTPRVRRLARLMSAAALGFGLLVAAIATTGGGQFTAFGRRVMLRGLYTPVLLLTLALLARAALAHRLRLAPRPGLDVRAAARLVGVGAVAALLLLQPLLSPLVLRVAQGRLVAPAIHWRSSPPGVDLLAFLMPNPTHPLFGDAGRLWLARLRPDGFVENTASLTFSALVVLLLALWRCGPVLPRFWVAFTAGFALLALGPFLWVGGVNTHVPTPWALLRYLPGIGLVRSPSRFAIVVMLGVAVLFAHALGCLTGASRRRRLALTLASGVLLFELAPCPRRLHAAQIPEIYRTVAADPCDVRVLELPFGLRDGTRSVGDFSARAQFHQTYHGKPLLGGYLSRISQTRVDAYRRFPVMEALITLSEGRELPPEVARRAWQRAHAFRRRSRVGFVVVDRRRASMHLRRFAIGLLQLERVERSWPYDLYVAWDAHTHPDCPLRAALTASHDGGGLPAAR